MNNTPRQATCDKAIAQLLTRDPQSGELNLTLVIQSTVQRLLRDRGYLRDAGIWDATKSYLPGDTCTHDGTLWACKSQNTGQRPGNSPGLWRLMHKSADVELRKL